MQPQHIAVTLDISGRVQGVGFRASMLAEAQTLQLAGWVRNRSDGHVIALVQGPGASVDAIIAWCRRGPSAARVESVLKAPCPLDAAQSRFACLPTVRG